MMKYTKVACNPKMKSSVKTTNFDDLFQSFLKPLAKEFVQPYNVRRSPAINVIESADSFQLEVAAPGLSKEHFKIKIDNNILSIAAPKQEETDTQFTQKEFNYNGFERKFELPDTININAISAKYESGILYIQLMKKEEAKVQPAREIEIA